MPGSVQTETREIHRKQLVRGMWLMPWYDPLTGQNADGGIPIPESVDRIEHKDDTTMVITSDAMGRETTHWFTDKEGDPKPEVVV